MTPMHHSRKDDPIDISQNFLEWLALLGWLWGQCGTNCTRFAVRRNAQLSYFPTKIRDPIRQSMQLFAENLRRGISEFFLHSDPFVMSNEAETSLAIPLGDLPEK
jgi:hypothetical protein